MNKISLYHQPDFRLLSRLPLIARCLAALAAKAFLVVGAVSCESVTCPLNNTVESVYGFYATERDADGSFIGGGAISIGDTLTITAAGTDTTLINRIYNTSTVSLPVSYYGDVDTLLFSFTDTAGTVTLDTVWVKKLNAYHFDDPSCPIHMFHEVQSVGSTHLLIDTIIVVDKHINYDGFENFQIYFFTE